MTAEWKITLNNNCVANIKIMTVWVPSIHVEYNWCTINSCMGEYDEVKLSPTLLEWNNTVIQEGTEKRKKL